MNRPCTVLLTLAVPFIVACQDKAAIAELEEHRAQVALEAQNKVLVKSAFDGLNKRDAAVYQELYAPEYGWHFPANNPKALTRDEEAAFVELLWKAFPDIRWEIVDTIASGDVVVARFTVTGTHKAEYQGIRPTGNKFTSGGVWTARIKSGKIVAVREEADVVGWMQQLGVELQPKKVTK